MNPSTTTSFASTQVNLSVTTHVNITMNPDLGLIDPHGLGRIPSLVFNCLLFVFGTIGNGLAIFINVQRYREQKNTRHRKDPYVVFVLSLALIDMFICVFSLPMDFVDNVLEFTLLPEDLCQVYRFLQYSFHITSVFHVALICIHCWRKVCFPELRQIERRLALKFCLGFYVVAFIATIPSFWIIGYTTIFMNGKKGPICSADDAYSESLLIKICMGYLATGFVIALMIIFTSYFAMLRHRFHAPMDRKNVSDSHSMEEEESITKQQESGKRTTTLIFLTLVFIVSYIPFMILALLTVFYKDFRDGWNVATLATYKMFLLFPYLNNVLNPIVYGCLDQEFRKRLKFMFAPLNEKCSSSTRKDDNEIISM